MASLILIDLRKVIDTASEFILTLQLNGREQFGFTGVSFRKRSGCGMSFLSRYSLETTVWDPSKKVF